MMKCRINDCTRKGVKGRKEGIYHSIIMVDGPLSSKILESMNECELSALITTILIFIFTKYCRRLVD